MRKTIHMVLLILMISITLATSTSAQMLEHQYAIIETSSVEVLVPLYNLPEQSAEISYSYYVGTLAKILGEVQSGWREVSIAGVYGYMEEQHLSFVDFAEMNTVLPSMKVKNKTDTGTLNLREKPSLESPIIRQYTNDEEVMVMGVSDEWYHVIGYGGRVGYMKPEFLEHTGTTSKYMFGEDVLQLRPPQ